MPLKETLFKPVARKLTPLTTIAALSCVFGGLQNVRARARSRFQTCRAPTYAEQVAVTVCGHKALSYTNVSVPSANVVPLEFVCTSCGQQLPPLPPPPLFGGVVGFVEKHASLARCSAASMSARPSRTRPRCDCNRKLPRCGRRPQPKSHSHSPPRRCCSASTSSRPTRAHCHRRRVDRLASRLYAAHTLDRLVSFRPVDGAD